MRRKRIFRLSGVVLSLLLADGLLAQRGPRHYEVPEEREGKSPQQIIRETATAMHEFMYAPRENDNDNKKPERQFEGNGSFNEYVYQEVENEGDSTAEVQLIEEGLNYDPNLVKELSDLKEKHEKLQTALQNAETHYDNVKNRQTAKNFKAVEETLTNNVNSAADELREFETANRDDLQRLESNGSSATKPQWERRRAALQAAARSEKWPDLPVVPLPPAEDRPGWRYDDNLNSTRSDFSGHRSRDAAVIPFLLEKAAAHREMARERRETAKNSQSRPHRAIQEGYAEAHDAAAEVFEGWAKNLIFALRLLAEQAIRDFHQQYGFTRFLAKREKAKLVGEEAAESAADNSEATKYYDATIRNSQVPYDRGRSLEENGNFIDAANEYLKIVRVMKAAALALSRKKFVAAESPMENEPALADAAPNPPAQDNLVSDAYSAFITPGGSHAYELLERHSRSLSRLEEFQQLLDGELAVLAGKDGQQTESEELKLVLAMTGAILKRVDVGRKLLATSANADQPGGDVIKGFLKKSGETVAVALPDTLTDVANLNALETRVMALVTSNTTTLDNLGGGAELVKFKLHDLKGQPVSNDNANATLSLTWQLDDKTQHQELAVDEAGTARTKPPAPDAQLLSVLLDSNDYQKQPDDNLLNVAAPVLATPGLPQNLLPTNRFRRTLADLVESFTAEEKSEFINYLILKGYIFVARLAGEEPNPDRLTELSFEAVNSALSSMVVIEMAVLATLKPHPEKYQEYLDYVKSGRAVDEAFEKLVEDPASRAEKKQAFRESTTKILTEGLKDALLEQDPNDRSKSREALDKIRGKLLSEESYWDLMRSLFPEMVPREKWKKLIPEGDDPQVQIPVSERSKFISAETDRNVTEQELKEKIGNIAPGATVTVVKSDVVRPRFDPPYKIWTVRIVGEDDSQLSDDAVRRIADRLDRQDGIHWAEDGKPRHGDAASPADPNFLAKGSWGQAYQDQWAMHRVGLKPLEAGQSPAWREALPRAQGRGTVQPCIVAVIGSGVDWTHPELFRQMWVNMSEDPHNGVDDDGNGYIDDLFGWNFLDANSDVIDRGGHDTHVAGVIAARWNNTRGIAGINPRARIMALKVANFRAKSDSVAISQAIFYAVDHGARVINISYSGKSPSRFEQRAIDYARDNDVLVVASAGNEGSNAAEVALAGNPGLFTVAGTTVKDTRAAFSNWGQPVDLAAPCMDILGLRARDTDFLLYVGENPDYEGGRAVVGQDKNLYRASGTSFATPIVSAAASLIWSLHPSLTADQVRNKLLMSCDDIETPGWDQFTGTGILNIPRAVIADPDYFLFARISQVKPVRQANKISIQVLGQATGSSLNKRQLQIGFGAAPADGDWITVATGDKAVASGLIGTLPLRRFNRKGTWTVRLLVTDKRGNTRQAMATLNLN